jgi:hypothetical protein
MDAWRIIGVFALLRNVHHSFVDLSLLGKKRDCDLAIHRLDEPGHANWFLRFMVSIVLQPVFDWDGLPNWGDSMVVLVDPTKTSGA